MTPRLRLLAAAAAVALVATLAPATTAAAGERKAPRAWPSGSVPGHLLVTARSAEVARALTARLDGRLLGRTVLVEVPVGEEVERAASLRDLDGVLDVEADHLRPMLARPDDPLFSQQWAHTVARAPGAWDVTTGSPAIEVAVIDTGIDGTHPGLARNIARQVDVSNGIVTPVPTGSDNDPCAIGHGTQVAGIIGATGDDGLDVAGVAWSIGIVDVAAGDRVACGLFADSAVLTGLTYATDTGVDVVNLSLGAPGDTCPTSFQSAIDRARASGIVVVAAAGNEEGFVPGLTSVPASCNGVISVGAVDVNGNHASYSNTNSLVDVAAPGGGNGGPGILTTARGGGTTTDLGTSFAAPYVSGLAALLLSVRDSLTPDQVESLLETTTRTPGVRSRQLGWGLVDATAAVTRLRSSSSVPDPAPDPVFPVGLVVRISAQTLYTDSVFQAAAMSKYVFPTGSAQHAVVARRDDFADALSGSALSFGAGPILYGERTGPLPRATAEELVRVLDPGSVVYLLGGTAALPDTLEGEIRALGFEPRRLGGTTRAGTAAIVADEVVRRVVELQFDAPTRVLLATGRNWPDAVTAGSFGAWDGYPVLLTEPGGLSPETRDALARLHPQRVYVVGGTSVIGDDVAAAAGSAAGTGDVVRLAGTDRNGTALAVAERFAAEFREQANIDPLLVVGVNLRRGDGFAHVLSAAPAIGAFSGIYLPVEGEGGDTLPDAVVGLACRLSPLRGLIAGDGDLVADATKQRLNALLEHTDPECGPR